MGDADVILHVVDGSHPHPLVQIEAVNAVLADVRGIERIPRVVAFNKSDLMDGPTLSRLRQLYPEAHVVSARTGQGIDGLRAAIEARLPVPQVHVEALLPYTSGSLLSHIRERGRVERVDYRNDGILLQADVDDRMAAQVVGQAID